MMNTQDYFNQKAVERRRKCLKDYDADFKQEFRKNEQRCKYCTYIHDAVVMNVYTKSTCRCCGKEMVFVSSYTDKYCLRCAKQLKICRHCGATMD